MSTSEVLIKLKNQLMSLFVVPIACWAALLNAEWRPKDANNAFYRYEPVTALINPHCRPTHPRFQVSEA